MNPRALILALTLAAAAAAAQPQSPAPADRAQLERRLGSVATLIESSSAARQIEGSGVAVAREKRDNARLIHREAAATLAAGDLAATAQLLDKAAREMMSGARLANPQQVNGEKDKRDLAARVESARALLAAQQRITQEKNAGAQAQEEARRIEQALTQAEQHAAAGRTAEARVLADRAYLTARVSIESLRRGDTLVRSLTFANKREEYDYEIDRNDTHRMLVTMVLSERGDVAPMVKPFVDRAAALRRDAEGQAGRGDHAGAIRALEDSTRELVRAIRAGGIYIPG